MKREIIELSKIIGYTAKETEALIESGDYSLMSDAEADAEARARILDSVWAFRPDFLAAHAKSGIDAEVFKAIQANDRCENNNAAVLALIEDVEHFISDAIASDGRGHLISAYDGEEIEITVPRKNGKTKYFYAYRQG
jgi:hypothetical protein